MSAEDLLKDQEFLRLEKEFKLLSRFREARDLGNLPYVIVDIETTGLYPDKAEVIEIGAIKTLGGEARDVFMELIEPDNPVPPEIERITGINQAMVTGKRKAAEVLPDFLKFIGDNILVAHNADFDIPFLKYHINKSLQKEMNNRSACTVKLSRALVPGLVNYKLHTVAEHFKVPTPVRHRAMGDCEITLGVWAELLKLLKERNIFAFDELAMLMR